MGFIAALPVGEGEKPQPAWATGDPNLITKTRGWGDGLVAKAFAVQAGGSECGYPAPM